ncbi:hypothetical protein BD310DRAFT_913334 [Dichomitus squalens]|uniref:Uncharacterized protein n=1 Tax=Dichomitus squalens TaxID=114155 RepID=A0A4Q9QAW6_9APHY|nr:hypothetical protein BD310DRAFT_913334 [Dichomitus squalens]
MKLCAILPAGPRPGVCSRYGSAWHGGRPARCRESPSPHDTPPTLSASSTIALIRWELSAG